MEPAPPSPGRIVHYAIPSPTRTHGEVRPAIVVKADGMSATLQVFTAGPADGPVAAGGLLRADAVPYDENGEPGTWCWPPRAAESTGPAPWVAKVAELEASVRSIEAAAPTAAAPTATALPATPAVLASTAAPMPTTPTSAAAAPPTIETTPAPAKANAAKKPAAE